mmetsp:Transcript_5030/g.13742  ORF Transcript_5030/g.13742 Transcript_5030/m.13742 type:complete len:92 (+) Transcript_5030:626-901(+)
MQQSIDQRSGYWEAGALEACQTTEVEPSTSSISPKAQSGSQNGLGVAPLLGCCRVEQTTQNELKTYVTFEQAFPGRRSSRPGRVGSQNISV